MFILFSLCMLYYQRISSSFILDDAMTFSYVEIRDEKIELPMNMWFTGFMMPENITQNALHGLPKRASPE